jgi:hypothetical protein
VHNFLGLGPVAAHDGECPEEPAPFCVEEALERGVPIQGLHPPLDGLGHRTKRCLHHRHEPSGGLRVTGDRILLRKAIGRQLRGAGPPRGLRIRSVEGGSRGLVAQAGKPSLDATLRAVDRPDGGLTRPGTRGRGENDLSRPRCLAGQPRAERDQTVAELALDVFEVVYSGATRGVDDDERTGPEDHGEPRRSRLPTGRSAPRLFPRWLPSCSVGSARIWGLPRKGHPNEGERCEGTSPLCPRSCLSTTAED